MTFPWVSGDFGVFRARLCCSSGQACREGLILLEMLQLYNSSPAQICNNTQFCISGKALNEMKSPQCG